MQADLPDFLREQAAFSQHLQDHLSDQPNTEKGTKFASFACKALTFMEFAKDFGEPQLAPKATYDGGVDFYAKHTTDDTALAGQSKLRIREVADLNEIISKFQSYEKTTAQKSKQRSLFPSTTSLVFVIVTSSDVTEIRRRYEQSALPSLPYFKSLVDGGRLHICDGPTLLPILQNLYRQSYVLAPEVEIEFGDDMLHVGNVYMSVVTGQTLRALYAAHGTSIFFENIREFIGVSNGETGDHNVNDAIVDTLKKASALMLGRNNGITFRADKVEILGPRRVLLSKGSIVNGCQTTMCVVSAKEAADPAMIAVKIVVDDDSWEVAKSANHQNRVSRIDLEIARFLRPQLVRKIATDLGYGMVQTKEPSISNVLHDIHLAKFSYDAIKLLYLGFFSRHPNNIFDSIYSEVRLDILNAMNSNGQGERILTILFQLWMQMGRARDSWRERLQATSNTRILETFKRFFEQEKLSYHCLLAILTACGCVNEDLMKKPGQPEEAYKSMMVFFSRLEVVLTSHENYFRQVFRHAFGVISERVLEKSKGEDISKDMFKDVVSTAGAQFANTVLSLRTRMAIDESLEKDTPVFSGPGQA